MVNKGEHMKKLVIVGHGGFGREVEWIIERINALEPTWDFIGYIDKDVNNPNVIGDDEFVINYVGELNVVIAICDSKVRKKIYERYKDKGNLVFPNIVDPSVNASASVVLGKGNIICAGVIATVDVTIGDFAHINLNCTIGHDVVVEDFVTVYPGVNISGKVHISSCASVGTGAQIIQGLSVGDNSTVGAGAVVNRSITSNCVAVGVPAKVIKTV